MGLKKYEVTVNGWPTTLLLSDEDAKAQGLLKDEPKKAAAPAKKAAAKPANKSRTASNKKA